MEIEQQEQQVEKPKKPEKKWQKQNDYSQHFINKQQYPGNFIRDVDDSIRYAGYPTLNELVDRKNQLLKKRNHPPIYLKADMKTFDLKQLGQFDVIMIDPPWQEYSKRIQHLQGSINSQNFKPWSLFEISKLDIPNICSQPTFLFMWCGSDHLLDARTLFNQWNFKRCDDIVWVKTNKKGQSTNVNTNEKSIFQKVTEHCLVGLRGDVRQASDHNFIHPNIDVDVIVDEVPPLGSRKKPDEIYRIIERFCLGRKRLELFGSTYNTRPGWVTVGKDITDTNFERGKYESWFQGTNNFTSFQGGRTIIGTQEIEKLRPKSPTRQTTATKQFFPKGMVPQQPYPFQKVMNAPPQMGGPPLQPMPQFMPRDGQPFQQGNQNQMAQKK